MKRGIIAAVILSLVIITAVRVSISLEHKTDTLYALAQSALYDRTQIDKLNEEWSRQVVYFRLFIDHSSFEALEKKIKKLRYADDKNYTTICTELILDIDSFKETVSLSIHNIF